MVTVITDKHDPFFSEIKWEELYWSCQQLSTTNVSKPSSQIGRPSVKDKIFEEPPPPYTNTSVQTSSPPPPPHVLGDMQPLPPQPTTPKVASENERIISLNTSTYLSLPLYLTENILKWRSPSRVRQSSTLDYVPVLQRAHPPCRVLLWRPVTNTPEAEWVRPTASPEPIRLRHDELKNQYPAISHCSVFNRLCCRGTRATCTQCQCIDKNTTRESCSGSVCVCVHGTKQKRNGAMMITETKTWEMKKTSQILLTM